MTNQHDDGEKGRRAAEKLAQWVWLTAVARVAAIIMPIVLAGIGAIALEWRGDFKAAQQAAQIMALETAKVLERVTIRQEALQKSDERQDTQIDRLWRRLRGGPAE